MGNLILVSELEKLICLGFSFLKDYGPNNKIHVSKHPVFENPTMMDKRICGSFEEAIEVASNFLNKPDKLFWSAIVRFNRGLGIEYKNLPDIQANSHEEATQKAEIEAQKMLKEPKLIILEIKVRLKN